VHRDDPWRLRAWNQNNNGKRDAGITIACLFDAEAERDESEQKNGETK
jgi:hypothetical protein